MIFRFICTAFFFLFISVSVNSQTPYVDSLKKLIAVASNASKKLEAILEVCRQFEQVPADTLYNYINAAEKLLPRHNNKDSIKGWISYYRGVYYNSKASYDSALMIIDSEFLKMKDKEYSNKLFLNFSYLKTNTLIRSNRHKDAIAEYSRILLMAEQSRDTFSMAKLMNGIGWAYMELDLDKEAINWFRKAVRVTDNIQYTKHFGRIYGNMGSAYNSLKLYDSAEVCVNRAIELNRAEQNVESLANALNIKADIYLHTGRKTQVEAVLTEALELRKKKGDPFYIVSDMFQLATYYAENGQPEKGIAVSLEGIEIAKKFNIASKLPVLMNALAENYKVGGNFIMHSETMEKLLVLKDSLYAANTAQALADIQGKYDLQKKENVIIRQQLELTKKDYLFYGSMMLLALALLIAWLIFRNYKRKQRMKMELALAEEKRETEKAIAEAEEKERRRIAADLHDNLGAYAASIAANVDHISLQSGNESIFSLQELRNNSQAIVSQLSDTIWALKKDALSLTAISDRLKVFIQRIQPGYPHISIDVTEEIETDFLLPPSQAFHLFRIMQEAINNALKHSGCTNVSVLIESAGQWKISIKDDGKGIAQSNTGKTGGNGIGNMKSRAHDAGWEIEWLRNEAGGTRVVIGPATIN